MIRAYLTHFFQVWTYSVSTLVPPLHTIFMGHLQIKICKLFLHFFGTSKKQHRMGYISGKMLAAYFFPAVNVFYRICDITFFCIKFRDFCGRHVCNVFAYSSITIAARIQLYFAQQFTMHFQMSDLLRQLLVLRPQKCSCSSQWAAKSSEKVYLYLGYKIKILLKLHS